MWRGGWWVTERRGAGRKISVTLKLDLKDEEIHTWPKNKQESFKDGVCNILRQEWRVAGKKW